MKIIFYTSSIFLLFAQSAASHAQNIQSSRVTGANDIAAAQQILRELLPDHPGLQVVNFNEISGEKVPSDYRPFVFGDFKGNGSHDVIICAVAPWRKGPSGAKTDRDAYFIIATRLLSGKWKSEYTYKATATPFVIWDEKKKILYFGAYGSDVGMPDIQWDKSKKIYKDLPSSDVEGE